LTYFVTLSIRSEGNDLKNGETTVGFSFTAMYTSQFWSWISLKKKIIIITTLEDHPFSPDLAAADFYLFP